MPQRTTVTQIRLHACRRGLLATLLVLAVSACSGSDAKRILGMERKSPDEFKVVSLPPLSLPPEYHLVPPRSDERHVRSDLPDKQSARELLTGRAAPEADTVALARSDQLMLEKAGIQRVLPDIRTMVEDDFVGSDIAEAEREKSFWEHMKAGTLLFDPDEGAEDREAVNPVSEAERLRKQRNQE